MDYQIYAFLASVAILYVLKKIVDFRAAINSVGNHPGFRTLLPANSLLSLFILPRIPGLTHGRNFIFKKKFSIYEESGWDAVADVCAFPGSQAALMLSITNAATIKEIAYSRAQFPKPTQLYKSLTMFGDNVIASEGVQWKTYRKIAAPAFSDRNSKLVWDETVRIMQDMFDNLWKNQDVITTDHCVDITMPIALFVIGVAAFGRRISWQDDLVVPEGHRVTFKEALDVVSTGVFVKLGVPTWAMGATEHLRKVQTCFEELDKYMIEMIEQRQTAEKKEERYDLFSSLLDANDADASSGEAPLSVREVIGNVFVFLLAGHETTAHMLAFTFGLLAFYQEEQETLYQHIKSIIPDGHIPTFEERTLLTQSMAVIYETLRLFPPINGIPKYAAEDTTIITESTVTPEERKVLPCPKDTVIVADIVGLHYNPRYWKDPEEFRPSRFREDWPRDAFLPFGSGARSCMGRKFSETEGVVILTMLISKYKIELKEEPQFAGETMDEKKARIFTTNPGITISPVRMPLVFKRRK